ncbi:hypothetical protein [Sphingomonas quercus]|uniref:Uncharacterized protein n=1 Tax=Sphingomonas quercus TaxID=2842451 RepID=A0ABS6BGV7_9SPHN|nr:hypothetical protein [Sphingomonas quercus]MBU3077538.1 hypothetical protein [Sphingomonas quercus]
MKPAVTIALGLLAAAFPALAATQTPPAAAPAAAPGYNVASTEIGKLLDDPAAKAVLDKYAPGLTTHPQIDEARPMTLKAVQPYAPDLLTDAVLANIQAELGKLSAR